MKYISPWAVKLENIQSIKNPTSIFTKFRSRRYEMAPDPIKVKSNAGIYSRVVSPSTPDPKGDDTHKHPPLAFLLPKGKGQGSLFVLLLLPGQQLNIGVFQFYQLKISFSVSPTGRSVFPECSTANFSKWIWPKTGLTINWGFGTNRDPWQGVPHYPLHMHLCPLPKRRASSHPCNSQSPCTRSLWNT